MMKFQTETRFAKAKFILRAAVACAGAWALLFQSGTICSRAESGTAAGVVLGGENMFRGRYQFSFEAKAGQVYAIGVSADLTTWNLLTNVVGAGAPLWFADLDAPKFSQRFYQIGVPAERTNMVFIRPGMFTMGSPDSEFGHLSNEGPQTAVTLTRGFWIGKYEVSQQEYIAVIGTNASWFTQDTRLPAESVSWIMATNYCAQLTRREDAAGRLPAGFVYRLPTEAEWEYACRARTAGPFGIGDGANLSSTQANFDGNFPYGTGAPGPYITRTTIPGRYDPNAWGIYDMHGNVWEWCQDWMGEYPGGNATDPKGPITGTERVLRGGGYSSLAKGCRSAERDSRRPGYASIFAGFRVVLGPAL